MAKLTLGLSSRQAAADFDNLDAAKLCVKGGADGTRPTPVDGRVARSVGAMSSDPSIADFFRHLGLFLGRYLFRQGPPAYRSATAVVVYAEDLGAGAYFERVFDDADSNQDSKLSEAEICIAAKELGVTVAALGFAKNAVVSKTAFVAQCAQLFGGSGGKSREVNDSAEASLGSHLSRLILKVESFWTNGKPEAQM